EARIRASHSLECHAEYHYPTPVNCLRDFCARDVRPERDLMEDAALDMVLAALVALRGPSFVPRLREHGGVLPRAVVVESRRPLARLSKNLRSTLGRGLVRSAGEITLFELEVAQHPLHE